MQYGTAISDAFAYARHSKAAPLYAGFIIFALLATLAAAMGAAAVFGLSLNPASWIRQPTGTGVTVLALIAGVAVFAIGSLGVSGTIIRNSAHAETLSESWSQFRPRLSSMIGVALIASVVSFASSMLFEALQQSSGALGSVFFVLQIAVSLALAFFLAFAEYAVALEGRKALDAVGRSVQLAQEKPVDVLLAIIVSAFLSIAILLAAAAILAVLLALAFILLRIKLNALTPLEFLLLGIAAAFAVFGLALSHVVQLHVMSAAFRGMTEVKPKKVQDKAPARRKTAANKPAKASARSPKK